MPPLLHLALRVGYKKRWACTIYSLPPGSRHGRPNDRGK